MSLVICYFIANTLMRRHKRTLNGTMILNII
jgi:hypothetical protein